MSKLIYYNGMRTLVVSVLIALIVAFSAFKSMAQAAGPDKAKGVGHASSYVINLVSYLEPMDPERLPGLKVFKKYRLYTTRHMENGKNWYRLRIGFFPDAKAAARVMKTLRGAYPEAWVTRVSSQEVARSSKLAIVVKPRKSVGAKRQARGKVAVKGATVSNKSARRLARIMESAEAAMKKGDYRLSAQLYTKVLQYKGHKFMKEARELLGLAYERSGRPTHAVAEYKAYLALYPKGEGAARVRQRLAGLETARAMPRKKLRKRKEQKDVFEVYGSFSQYYNRDENYTDLGGNVVTRSSVSNDIDINLRKRTAEYELKSVLIAGHELDLLDLSESDIRLSRLYVDILDKRRHLSGRLGRQSRSTGGVLGRFDGALAGYQLFPRVKLNVVTGYPVETSKLKSIDTERYFYGLSIDLGTFLEAWDFNTFIINQQTAGITDRRAVGGEVRYYRSGRSLFSLIDYDISYDELNTALLVGNWTLPGKTIINTSIDYRKSPTLTTTNALQSQTVDSISDMLETWSEDSVRSLAMDRTATSKSLMIGATRPFNEKLQISGDFTVTELTGTPASGGVEAMDGTGYEYFYSVQLIGSSIIKEADTAILGLRYSDTSTADTLSLSVNTRYPVNRELRINPRLRLDFSKVHRTDAKRLKIRPSLRADYYWKRHVRFEFEGGLELAYERVANRNDDSIDYFLRTGYRYEF